MTSDEKSEGRIAKAYRYAKVEIAFLPQQTERFDGLAVVTSNLLANLDDALIRDLPNRSPLSRAAMQSIPRLPGAAYSRDSSRAGDFRLSLVL